MLRNELLFAAMAASVFFVSASMIIGNASAVTLTEEQKRIAASLSDKEKAELARQAEVSLPAPSQSDPKRDAPVAPRSRSVGTSNLELTAKQTGAPEPEERPAISAAVDVPVEKVTGQGDAERLEVRRAFADFAKDSEPLRVDTNIKQFGYELFAGSPDTFAPATDVPVPAEYVLGPGDELNIHLYGREDQDLVLVVDREGEIAFPQLGPLAVAGMGFSEAKAFIAQQVKEKMVGITADISMGKLRSIRIFALGEVAHPGSYTVSSLSTISNALFVSGGVKKSGSLRNVQLKRSGQVMAVIDLYDFLLKGDTSEDERLLPGDVVFVPPIGRTAAVAGQVNRPAIYELKREQTVSELVGLAGGLLPTAYKEMALVERIDPAGGQSTIEISLAKREPTTTLQNGDLLKVFSVTDYENNPVYLLGHVKRPGKYAWHKGMQLKEILASADALLPEAKLDYGIVERESGINRETAIIHFNLLDAISGKQSLSLEPRDKIYVFKRAQLREMPMTQIVGSVLNPGKYEVKKDMRLWDLVMAAGGMRRDALLDDVELYRENSETRDITVQRYNLKAGPSISELENPLLQDLDRVVVHSIWEEKKRYSVNVSGEVTNPGGYPLVAGMKISDLVFAAGGITERAYAKVAELTRYEIVDGEKRKTLHQSVDLAGALRGGPEDLELKPFDVLMVRQISNWRAVEHVRVEGEVKFPGIYPIEEGETLANVIERAGGYTGDAYLTGSVFTRESIRAQQQKELDESIKRMEEAIAQAEVSMTTLVSQEVIQSKQKGLEAAKRLLERSRQLKAQGRLVIELASLERMKSSEFNMTLRDGDRLYIPKRPDQVLVIGQVLNTMAMVYRPGYDVDDYLDDSGGLTDMADSDKVYVIKANGRVVRAGGFGWGRNVSIAPGDTIVVPEKLDHFNLLDSALNWSKAMAQIGVTVAAMVAIGVL